MKSLTSFSTLSDRELLNELKRLAAVERGATVDLIASLAEVDARRLYLSEGCSSLYTYCTRVLHLSEHAAYGRIEAARAARRFPTVLGLLADGSLTLTSVTLLAPHLTADNHQELLVAARHRSKREVEEIVAAVRPMPDVAATIHQLRVAPLAPDRYRIQFTIGSEAYDRLRRAQDLLRHVVPSGDPAEIFDRALQALLIQLEKQKTAATARPRQSRGLPKGRTIPSAVRREVWRRDEGRCAYVGREGRCGETGWLEFHHVTPYASGGLPSVENIELRCRAHNQHESRAAFGVDAVGERSSLDQTEWTRGPATPAGG